MFLANEIIFFDNDLFRMLEMQASACQIALLKTFYLSATPQAHIDAPIQWRIGEDTESRTRQA
jgi:hypothetical protein